MKIEHLLHKQLILYARDLADLYNECGDWDRRFQATQLQMEQYAVDLKETIRELKAGNEDLKSTRSRLEINNRALQTLSACNECLIRSTDETEIIRKICDIIVTKGGYPAAWVGLWDQARKSTMNLVAESGLEEGGRKILIEWFAGIPRVRPTPVARLLDSNQSFIVVNSRDNEIDGRHKIGSRPLILLPLRDNGKDLGVLAIFKTHPDTFEADEIDLLTRMSENLAYGICVLRIRQEHQESTQQVINQAELLNRAQDAIFVISCDRRITYWNQGAERLYGWMAAEVLNESVISILPEMGLGNYDELLSRTIERGEWIGEARQRTKEGREIFVQSRWSTVAETGADSGSILAINTDLSAEKQLREQLNRAQRMESIGSLAGGIAHDLNNILAPILLCAHVLKETDKPKSARRHVALIENSAKRGADIVRQVLTFARGLKGECIELQPRHILADIEYICRETFPRNITIVNSIADDLWKTRIDSTQLHQVLMNLCLNARDAMPDGGELALFAGNVQPSSEFLDRYREAVDQPYIHISVSDSGTGIPDSYIERIFEPLFSTKEAGKGTGLGLATVVDIVKQYAGIIDVRSREGQGSTFHVYLPAIVAHEDDSIVVSRVAIPSGDGELILIVDDEAGMRDIAKQTIESFNYRVLTAGNGAEAVGLFAQNRDSIKLVLIDVMMPVLDGSATVKSLRVIEPNVRVVMMSGIVTAEFDSVVETLKVQGFLTKPFDVEQVMTTIHDALSS